MVKMNNDLKSKQEDSTSQIINSVVIVNKDNYNTSLIEFRNCIKDSKCKFVFFNIEFSNMKFLTEKLNFSSESEDFLYLRSYLEEMLKIRNVLSQNNPQIIYTEFLICLENGKEKNSFKFYPYLIPSLKFHKFREKESLINLDPDTLSYLNFLNTNYSLTNICEVKTISYLNYKEEEKVKNNFIKILEEGKPTKKENTKSYYYFPKNIVVPTKGTKSDLEDIIQEILILLKDRKNNIDSLNDTTEEYTKSIKNNFYIVERLLNFEWRHILNPYSRDLIRSSIQSVQIKNAKINLKEIEQNVFVLFFKFCGDLANYLSNNFDLDNINCTKLYNFNYSYNSDWIEDKFFINWRSFLEWFFEHKILTTLTFSKNYVSFNFRFSNSLQIDPNDIKELVDLIKRFVRIVRTEGNDVFSEESIFKKNYYLQNLNFYYLIPKKIHRAIDVVYTIAITYDLTLLRNVNLDRKNLTKFEDLFLNLNNDKEILFDYEIEKELYLLISGLKKQIEDKYSPLNNLFIANDGLLKDLFIFFHNKNYLNILEDSFKGYIKIEKVNEKKREIVFSYKYEDREKLKIDLFLTTDLERDLRYELIKIFTRVKKETVFMEEFGVSNFFRYLFFNKKEDTTFTVVGTNLLQKFIFIYFEIFNNDSNFTDEMFDEFLLFFQNINFVDLNFVCKKFNQNIIHELNSGEKTINAVKYFNIFEKMFLKGEKIRNEIELFNRILIHSTHKSNNKFQYLDKNGHLRLEAIEDGSNLNKFILKTKNGKNLSGEASKIMIEICKSYGDFMVNFL
jgi:hypothetical protein